jgi:polysaccharide biosynthesis/export protein
VKLTKFILVGLLILPNLCRAQGPAVPERKTSVGLAPGDQIDVRMYDFPDLGAGPIHAHVRADGAVHLPYAGTIQVAGMSPDEFEHAVADSLKSKGIVKDPNVTVEVVSAVNMMVHVMGQVQTPKAIPVTAPVPISFVLSAVGGTTGMAAHHLTIIHPDNQPPTSVDYDINRPTSAALNTLVQPGDVVDVSNGGIYFVAGEVNRPGIFPLGGALSIGQASGTFGFNVVKNMTLLEALTQAGGITNIAARSKMLLIRTIDGKREQIVVDQVKLYKGEVADPVLQADDIIYVPSSYLRQQTNNLFTTALSSLYAAAYIKSF